MRFFLLGELTVVLVIGFFFFFTLPLYFGSSKFIFNGDPWKNDTGPYPSYHAQNLFWFLQLTDIHLSFVHNMTVSKSLLDFCHEVVKVVKPSLVLVTGDITHAKFADETLSQQFLVEWESYRDLLKKCNLGQMPWLDIRGNHDSFDVPSLSHSANYFMKFSRSWRNHTSTTKSYSYIHHTAFGDYNFIAMDACPVPGPKRPFNFFGILHEEDLSALSSLSAKKVNQTVWFSHYPSAIIATNHLQLQELMSSSIAHVSGHLHTFGGLMHAMYARHPAGLLELELADFRWSRRFRLMAFDHDLFSFSDISLGDWPLILVTNPKDARFISPSREPTRRMFQSSHVRMLIFSPQALVSVQLLIDEQVLPTPVLVNDGPLYVSPWQPANYASGLHDMRVVAMDAFGRSRTYRQTFSLDNTAASLDMAPDILLLTNLHSVMRCVFLWVWLSLILVVLLARANIWKSPYLHRVVHSEHLFYPYLMSVIYFGVGPWYVGELLTGEFGFVCVHGLYVLQHFIPGSLTYFYAVLQIVGVYLPLVLYLNFILLSRVTCWHSIACHSLMCFSFMLQLFFIVNIVYPYGRFALFISPGGTWPVLLNLWLIYSAYRTRRQNQLILIG